MERQNGWRNWCTPSATFGIGELWERGRPVYKGTEYGYSEGHSGKIWNLSSAGGEFYLDQRVFVRNFFLILFGGDAKFIKKSYSFVFRKSLIGCKIGRAHV